MLAHYTKNEEPGTKNEARQRKPKPELLAPAGDATQLDAAMQGGADAVYFGVTGLNARRRADNFSVSELPDIASKLHEAGVKAYLTLNINLTHRDLGQAVSILDHARNAHIDAVLFTDPAILLLREHFPELSFHWSTQAAATTSAGVEAAARLGINRVILPREMTLEEIKSASSIKDVGTEVFVQGALCFSVSGRCLLSSWGGGRSGNRGLCTSPCRVPWSIGNDTPARIFSMRDLCLIEHIPALANCGVEAFKIEGRLKTADWTYRAVSAYRAVLNGESPASVEHLTKHLGDYTGRSFTSGYVDDRRDTLLSPAARPSSHGTGEQAESSVGVSARPPETQKTYNSYDISISLKGNKLHCVCTLPDFTTKEKDITRPKVRKQNRGVRLDSVEEILRNKTFPHAGLASFSTETPELLVPRRTANAIVDWVGSILHRSTPTTGEHRPLCTHTQHHYVKTDPPTQNNTLTLGDTPNRVRVTKQSVEVFAYEPTVRSIVVEDAVPSDIPELLDIKCNKHLCVALPSVFFEDDLAGLRDLVHKAASHNVPLEVNSWDGWQLVNEAQAEFEAGPGLPVLNSWASQALKNLGCSCVTVSVEADRETLEACTARSPLPCCVYVGGRPLLAITRAEVPEVKHPDIRVQDKRGITLISRMKRDLTLLYPHEPFSYAGLTNEAVKAQWLAIDLAASPAPYEEWTHFSFSPSPNTHRFNYNRKLR